MKKQIIKAVRNYLELSQSELADAINVNPNTISRAEDGAIGAPTERALESFFKSRKIEINDKGFQELDTVKTTYEGQEGFQRFYDDLYLTTKLIGGKVCIFNGISEFVTGWLGDEYVKKQVDRMLEIETDFRFDVIVKEGDAVFFGQDYCTYKWFPAELFNDQTIYLYGSKVAFINFQEDNVIVEVIDQDNLSKTMHLFFTLAWDYVAKDVPNE